MNPQIISINLNKNINKFFALNTLVVIAAIVLLFLLTDYEKKICSLLYP